MEFSKLKIKSNDIRIYNIHESVRKDIEDNFTIIESDSNIIMTIVCEDEFKIINKYIDGLDYDIDFVLWIMYPKGTSKKFKGIVEVNRDDIRMHINDRVKTVSLVSLDDDWSAMRLRNKKFSKV